VGARTEGKGLIDARELGFAKLKFSRPGVLGGVFWTGGLGDSKERGLPHQAAQRYLARGRVVRGGNLLQHTSPLRARTWKVSMTERAVGNHGNIVLLTPRQHSVLDGALLQMVEN
jgi:hypothetical protein